MALNNVSLVGRLVRDPEIRNTQTGVSVCNFCIAVDRPYKTGEDRETDFIDCVSWRGGAEFVSRYFHKGDMIGVSGRLQTRTWQDDKGAKRKAVEVITSELSFVGGKRNAEAPAEKQTFAEIADKDDDLPF